jgi:hypothetical protein
MNSKYMPGTLLLRKVVTLGLGLAAIALPAKAQIIANFTAGNTTTQVDGYAGMAGSGWLGPWTTSTWGGDVSFSNSVIATTQMGGGDGNYLSANLTSVAPDWDYGDVCRKWDPTVISSTAAYTISFLMRLDTPMANQNDSFNIMGDTGSGYAQTTGPTNTFFVNGYFNGGSPVWQVNDGDTQGGVNNILSTGMALNVGTVYSFVISVDPVNQSYTVSIYDGTNLYQSPVLGLRGTALDGGSSLYFLTALTGSTGALTYSLDSVNISAGTPTQQEAVTNMTDTVPWTDPPQNGDDSVPKDDSYPPPVIPVNDDTTIQDEGGGV